MPTAGLMGATAPVPVTAYDETAPGRPPKASETNRRPRRSIAKPKGVSPAAA